MLALFLQAAANSDALATVLVLAFVAVLFAAMYFLSKVKLRKARWAAEIEKRNEARWQGNDFRVTAATVGVLLGGFVGYLLAAPPYMSIGDILSRGQSLQGISALMRPAAESAFNFMLAGAILGAVAGVVIASVTSNQRAKVDGAAQSQHSPAETSGPCPYCGAQVPVGMQFCGKCGKSVASITCRQCGKAVPQDQQFCGACGMRVG